jgi:type IV secretion system protein TrbL
LRIQLVSLLIVAMPLVWAQAPSPFTSETPANILDQFHDASKLWLLNAMSTAQYLFWALAILDFIVMATSLVVEGSDFHGWAGAVTRKLLFIGFWWTLLVNAQDWLPAVINSFNVLGQRASGTPIVHPTDVFTTGLKLAGALVNGGVGLSSLINPATALFSIVAAIIVAISYALIAVTFLMTVIEGYIGMSVGYIFLGLAGSRWTNDYAMRYLSLVVGVGVKLLLLYCLIGAGSELSVAWSNELAASSINVMVSLDVCAGSLMFALLCWHVPRLFSTLMSGSPTLGHGEAVAALTAITVAATRLTSVVSSGAASSSGGASAAGASASSAGSASSNGIGSSVAAQVASVKAAGTSVSPPNGREFRKSETRDHFNL